MSRIEAQSADNKSRGVSQRSDRMPDLDYMRKHFADDRSLGRAVSLNEAQSAGTRKNKRCRASRNAQL